MSEKSCLYSLKNCSNVGIKCKLSALLYISYLAGRKYYESMVKPLIVTFKDVGIYFFLIWLFRFLSIYTLFSNIRRPFCLFVIFYII